MTLVAGLEQRGLVSRDRRQGDRRAYEVRLSKAGDHLRLEALAALMGCEETFLQRLSAELRPGLREALLRLI